MNLLETRELEYATVNDKSAAISNLIRDRNAFLKTAKNLLKAGETRSLDESERKEVDDVIEKVKDHDMQIRALQEKCSVGGDDDDESEEEDPDAMTEGRSNFVPSSRRSVTASRSRKAMPARSRDYNNLWGVHTREHRYSLGRAVQACARGRGLTGLEAELSKECERRNGRSPRGNSFFLPLQMSEYETRTGETTTTSASGAVTITWSNDFLLLLRKQSILEKLGITTVPDLSGNYVVPFETAGASAAFVAEGSQVDPHALSVSTVTGIPRELISRFVVTRQMVASSSYNLLDDVLKRDMLNSTAETLSEALVTGNQISNPASPQGLIENPHISVSTLASPSTLAWEDLLSFQTAVANANPPQGAPLKFLISPNGAQILRSRPRINSGSVYPSFCMESYGSEGNTVAGDDTVISTCIPDSINGSALGGGSLTAMIYGAFGEAVRHLVFGNSVEILVDPYSLGSFAEIQLYSFLLTDFVVPRPSLLTMAFYS